MTQSIINYNERPDPVLHPTTSLSPYPNAKRIVDIALPFFALYTPTRHLMTAGLGLCRTWSIIKNDQATLINKSYSVLFCVSGVALSILVPTVGTFMNTTYDIGRNLLLLGNQIKQKQLKEAMLTMGNILTHSLFLASIITGGPELILASMLLQVIKEVHHAFILYTREQKTPESMASLLMAIIRGFQATLLARKIHHEYNANPLTQESLKEVLEVVRQKKARNPDRQIDFGKILYNRNYKSEVKGISFTQELAPSKLTGETDSTLSSIQFKNLKFRDCDFLFVTLEGSKLENVTAINTDFSYAKLSKCQFQGFTSIYSTFTSTEMRESQFTNSSFYFSVFFKSTFHRSSLSDVTFASCELQDVNMTYGNLSNVLFRFSDLSYTAFNSSHLDKVLYSGCNLRGSTFLESKVSASELQGCDLTNTLLLDTKDQFSIEGCTPNVMTGPVILLLWDFEKPTTFTSYSNEGIKDAGGIPLRFDKRIRDVSLDHLTEEVDEIIDHIRENGLPNGAISIPDAIVMLTKEGSTLDRIRSRTEGIASLADAELFAGGLDVDPKYYGQERGPILNPDPDDRRTITEIFMNHHLENQQKPIMTLCRGTQLMNVIHGGTLHQHVPDHLGVVHTLHIKDDANPEAAEHIRDIIGNWTRGYSAHHQGINLVGDRLEVVMEHDGIPEALATRDGKKVLLQFHPERYIPARQAAIEENGGVEPYAYLFSDGKNFFVDLVRRAREAASLR